MNQRKHFEQLYKSSSDPWGARTSWYERRKRQLLLSALPRERYRHGFEPGCGNGEVTAALLERCEQLTAADFSESAIRICRAAVNGEHRGRLHLQRLQIPEEWPRVPGSGFDLLFVSELAYYMSDSGLEIFKDRCMESLRSGGHWLMCHWTHQAPDILQAAKSVHALISANSALKKLVEHREADFILDVWEKS